MGTDLDAGHPALLLTHDLIRNHWVALRAFQLYRLSAYESVRDRTGGPAGTVASQQGDDYCAGLAIGSCRSIMQCPHCAVLRFLTSILRILVESQHDRLRVTCRPSQEGAKCNDRCKTHMFPPKYERPDGNKLCPEGTRHRHPATMNDREREITSLPHSNPQGPMCIRISAAIFGFRCIAECVSRKVSSRQKR
jgi:hypothetical protein